MMTTPTPTAVDVGPVTFQLTPRAQLDPAVAAQVRQILAPVLDGFDVHDLRWGIERRYTDVSSVASAWPMVIDDITCAAFDENVWRMRAANEPLHEFLRRVAARADLPSTVRGHAANAVAFWGSRAGATALRAYIEAPR